MAALDARGYSSEVLQGISGLESRERGTTSSEEARCGLGGPDVVRPFAVVQNEFCVFVAIVVADGLVDVVACSGWSTVGVGVVGIRCFVLPSWQQKTLRLAAFLSSCGDVSSVSVLVGPLSTNLWPYFRFTCLFRWSYSSLPLARVFSSVLLCIATGLSSHPHSAMSGKRQALDVA